MTDTVVKTLDRQHLETLAASFRELMILKGKQATTQAKLIRWCVMAITQTTDQAQRTIEREHIKSGKRGAPSMMAASKKVRDDRELALLYLQWLATRLEDDMSSQEPSELDIRVEAAILDTQ